MDSEHIFQQNKQLKILNAIAHQLNQEVELRPALQTSLQYIVELLELTTAWIWLVQPNTQSVYLAASHQLPPAFTQHPERLSGWCYCIEKYLTDRMDTTVNISEISCTRLKDLHQGTAGLRYHASIPLFSGKEKIGIINVLSSASQQLTEAKLDLLHTIGDLVSMAIQRTVLFEQSKTKGAIEERKRLSNSINDQLLPTLDRLIIKLQAAQLPDQVEKPSEHQKVLEESELLANHLMERVQEFQDHLKELAEITQTSAPPIRYPGRPISAREKEVLQFLQTGHTNKQIADHLFISERTVKFHVSAILQKLDAANRTEAVEIARRRGLLV